MPPSALSGVVGNEMQIVMEPGGAQLLRGMEQWTRLLDDYTEVWPYVIRLIRAHHARTFDSEGSATGGGLRRRWAPLSPRYAAAKARRYPGRPILVRTSALRTAMVEGGPGSRVKSGKKAVEVGLRGRIQRIAEYHQKGTPIMPARPPVQFDADVRGEGSLARVVSQMIQTAVVAKRRKTLMGEVMDAGDYEKQANSLANLARRKTR